MTRAGSSSLPPGFEGFDVVDAPAAAAPSRLHEFSDLAPGDRFALGARRWIVMRDAGTYEKLVVSPGYWQERRTPTGRVTYQDRKLYTARWDDGAVTVRTATGRAVGHGEVRAVERRAVDLHLGQDVERGSVDRLADAVLKATR